VDEFFRTFLHHWPPAVAALSMPTRHRVLGEDDVRALLSHCPETRALIGYRSRLSFSESLLAWIEETVAGFSAGAFARLGGCSFTTSERDPRKISKGEQVERLLTHPGVRAASLAYMSLRAKQAVTLCIREWREIAPWSEFRIFIRRREVVGISQYHWRRIFPEIEENLEAAIDAASKAALAISAVAHLDDVVADIYLTALNGQASWVLIEFNPYPVSGRCLFDAGFDLSFRYRRPTGEVSSVPLYGPRFADVARTC
jgi:hypothetical protein